MNEELTLEESIQQVIDYNKKMEQASKMHHKLTQKEKEDMKKNIDDLKSKIFK